MPANFPSNPTNNQTYVYNNIRWKFNGYSWQIDLETGLPIGATGSTCPTGVTGPGGGGGGNATAINVVASSGSLNTGGGGGWTAAPGGNGGSGGFGRSRPTHTILVHSHILSWRYCHSSQY